VSRTFNYRIGCAKRRMLSKAVLPDHVPLSIKNYLRLTVPEPDVL
jgi:hypothetical protein